MRTILRTFLCLIALALSGCPGNQAQELFETAQFEEKQNNQAHARELYEQIVNQYPGSEAAKKAHERLASLQSAGSGSR